MRLRTTGLRTLGGLVLLAASAGAAASAHSILLGVGTHVVGHVHEQQPQFDLVQKLDLDAVRDDFLWQYAETSKGVYHIPYAWDQYVKSARQRGIQTLAIIDYGNKLYDNGNKPRSH